MTDLTYRPISHDHEAFIKKAQKRKGFAEAYAALADEYALAHELLAARSRAGLTQEEVAQSRGTTKSAVSRLESVGRSSPSVTTLKKYARAVGCEVEIHLVPVSRPAKASRGRAKARR
ncbi:MAG TPA: helix-turn-helix transcriptional regulator [Thermoanaerobaculia bacterium]|jgi:DNA-binding XRE family transcriptional regulator|nr:helix-turn-helix transcriptional regulator [Thermoanaerobaculia bacterium]